MKKMKEKIMSILKKINNVKRKILNEQEEKKLNKSKGIHTLTM